MNEWMDGMNGVDGIRGCMAFSKTESDKLLHEKGAVSPIIKGTAEEERGKVRIDRCGEFRRQKTWN